MKFTAVQIAQFVNGDVRGNEEKAVNNIAKIEEATQDDLAFIANPKYVHFLKNNNAGIILINKTFENEIDDDVQTFILVEDAYASFTQLLQQIDQLKKMDQSLIQISDKASIHPTAEIASDISIEDFCKISENAKVGNGSVLQANVTIGKNVTIGENCLIYSGVRILDDCIIGNNVIIHSNVVIGSDGFGFAPNKDGIYSKIPQLGNVIIKDDVEIGANTTIDRATMGSTIIEEGVKIDNLVQIAHNVTIGAHTVIAAQAGISGSTKVGKHCVIGGQAGLVGHIIIADGTKINAQSGVAKSVTINDSKLTGSPAYDYYASLKSQTLLRKLPDIVNRLNDLEKKSQ